MAKRSSPTSVTLAASPASPDLGDSVRFTGTGYPPGADVLVLVSSEVAGITYAVAARADGSIDTADTELYRAVAGRHTVTASVPGSHKPLASLSFDVS